MQELFRNLFSSVQQTTRFQYDIHKRNNKDKSYDAAYNSFYNVHNVLSVVLRKTHVALMQVIGFHRGSVGLKDCCNEASEDGKHGVPYKSAAGFDRNNYTTTTRTCNKYLKLFAHKRKAPFGACSNV
jgi:hypothetical protein